MHILHDNYTVGENGRLFVGGCDTVALAQKYGTPLYVIDEGKIRSNMQRFSALLRLVNRENGRCCDLPLEMDNTRWMPGETHRRIGGRSGGCRFARRAVHGLQGGI